MFSIPINIHPSWHNFFKQQYALPYMSDLFSFLDDEIDNGTTIYPARALWFKAFELPLSDIRLTIVGQDPYFNADQAMGLSFSVPVGEKIPPSLRNIYKELHSDLGMSVPTHGDLSRWQQQGIFLLNASLTVAAGEPGSHLKKGWQRFTLAAIEHINQQCSATVFLAWGAFAHKCCAKVDTQRHVVVKTSHPSPLGAYKTMKVAPAFLGSKCFSGVNEYLKKQGKKSIDWSVI